MSTEPGYYAFVGTYTDGASEGIYTCTFDGATNQFDPVDVTDAGPNPSFLAVHPNGEFLYAVNEVKEGSVTALSVDHETGELTVLNRIITGGGPDPCYCAVDTTGQYIFLTHYNGGAVAVIPIRDDGRVGEPTQVVEHGGSGPNEQRQEAAHPHCIRPGPQNRFVYVADLGTDGFYCYEFDVATGTLERDEGTMLALPSGSGPRHFDFHPVEDRIYLLNELSSTLTAIDRDPGTGTLTVIDSASTLPADYDGDNLTADVHVDGFGRRVYASNRGHDSIAVFDIDDRTGGLSFRQRVSTGGEWPRNFSLSPTGKRLLAGNMDTDEVVMFAIDSDDGTLDATGEVVEIPTPSCLQFTPIE